MESTITEHPGILYDVWVHKEGSHLENIEDSRRPSQNSSPNSPYGWVNVDSLRQNLFGGNHSRENNAEQSKSRKEPTFIALSPSGNIVAQLHRSTISFRQQQNDYATVVSKWSLDIHDPYPELQRICWNPSGELLAFVSSSLQLFLISHSGETILDSNLNQLSGTNGSAVVDMCWIKHSALGSKSWQLFVLFSSGVLWRFLVTVYKNSLTNSYYTPHLVPLSKALELKDDPSVGPTSNLWNILDHFSYLNCMDISPCGKYLVIGGATKEITDTKPDSSATVNHHLNAIAKWKLMDFPPFFDFIPSSQLDHLDSTFNEPSKNRKCCGKIRLFSKKSQKADQNSTNISPISIQSVQFSPDSRHLLTLDDRGTITIWDAYKQLPLKILKSESLWIQTKGVLVMPVSNTSDHIVKLTNWWDNTSIAIMHQCGVFTIFGPLVEQIDSQSQESKQTAYSVSKSSSESNLKDSLSTVIPNPELPSSSAHHRQDAFPSSATGNEDSGIGIPLPSSSLSIYKSQLNTSSSSSLQASITKRRLQSLEARNLLGDSPEKFAPHSITSRSYHNKIFIFETEISTVSVPKKRLLYSGDKTEDVTDVDPDQYIPFDYETEGAAQPPRLIKAAMSAWRFFVGHTDDKWGETMILKSRVSHRLLSLRKTIPEALFASKVEAGEYAFALNLATMYKLNTDFAYQKKWRLTNVTAESIKEHLDRIGDREWVLRECIERIPRSMEGAVELLNYGIKHALPSWITSNLDEKRELTETERKILDKKIREASFSKSEVKIILQRLILLSHRDRLQTYVFINKRKHFDAKEYLNFRTCHLVNACSTFAQNEDTNALASLWTYHASITLKYRLILLFYLPETLSPDSPKCSSLFPSIDLQSGTAVKWPTQQWRPSDWCERLDLFNAIHLDWDECAAGKDIGPVLKAYAALMFPRGKPITPHKNKRRYPNQATSLGNFTSDQLQFHFSKLLDRTLCEDIFSVPCEEPEPLCLDKPLPKYFKDPIDRELSKQDLSKWYKCRAKDIESMSGQVDNSLALIRHGMRHGVPNLEKMLEKLELLHSLVYECGRDIRLADLDQMDDFGKFRFLLGDATPSTFLKILFSRCQSYLQEAHRSWDSYMLQGNSSFTSSIFANWMLQCAKATENKQDKQAISQFSYVVTIFQSSAEMISELQTRGMKSGTEKASRSTPSSPIHFQPQRTHPQPHAFSGESINIVIPNSFMLATLGLYICYNASMASAETLNQLRLIYQALPKRPPPESRPHQQPSSTIPHSSSTSSLPRVNSIDLALKADSESIAERMDFLYFKIEQLGKHLKIASILHRHDLILPFSSFTTQWTAEDAPQAQLLFERLLQRDVRAHPPLTNAQWRETWNDLQELREIINSLHDEQQSFAGITPSLSSSSTDSAASVSNAGSSSISSVSSSVLSVDFVNELFCKALLRAGNFSFAKHYIYRIDHYEDLVISVSQEYFNSCSSAEDKAMDMARECLQLIKNPSSQVEEEKELIEGVVQMSKLEDKYQLDATEGLPLQVRRSKDRMYYLARLIDSTAPFPSSASNTTLLSARGTGTSSVGLTSSSSTIPLSSNNSNSNPSSSPTRIDPHTQLAELIDLARKLGCGSTVNERLTIKRLVATRAFKNRDYEVATDMATELALKDGHAAAWELAMQLSSTEQVPLQSRIQLLSFAMRYAPQESLQAMTLLWRFLMARKNCNSLVEDAEKIIGSKSKQPPQSNTHQQQSSLPIQVSSSHHKTAAASSSSSSSSQLIRMEPRKIHQSQFPFVTGPLSRLAELNHRLSKRYIHHINKVEDIEDPHQIYGFYNPVPFNYAYKSRNWKTEAAKTLTEEQMKVIESYVVSSSIKLQLLQASYLDYKYRESSMLQLAHQFINDPQLAAFWFFHRLPRIQAIDADEDNIM